jgi:hypothetical protein
VADLKRLDGDDVKPTTVVCATGSGGTTAGLALGARLSGVDIRVVGVNVCDDRDYFVAIIDDICRQFNQTWLPGDSAGIPPYDIVDGYVGRGYALSRPEELAAIRDLVRLEGVVLDPVYTGKAYFGMMAELAKDPNDSVRVSSSFTPAAFSACFPLPTSLSTWSNRRLETTHNKLLHDCRRTGLLTPARDYRMLCDTFRWEVPNHYNIGVDICDKWAHQPDRLALIYESDTGQTQRYTFRDLKQHANRLANGLKAMGIGRGDRVGILLPQRPETAISHIAIYKLGAIAIPLFTLFGTDALAYRLGNSQASGVITDAANLPKILAIRDSLTQLRVIIVTDGDAPEGVAVFQDLLDRGSDTFTPVLTRADDPALIIYTSGTTGPPKGALHAHRVLLGHLPGVEFPHNFFPREGDRFWTPADWAWIGGLIDVLFPSWHHGIPVVAHRARKFDPEEAFHLLARHRIRNAFMPPTA